jgi:hypothetical protein
MQHRFNRTKYILLVIAGFLGLPSTALHAQADITATRSAEFSAFGGFTYTNTDYRSPYNTYGGTVGADFTKFIPHFRGLITPSFEVRGSFVAGPVIHLKDLEGGIRIASTYHRLHPYGDFLLGQGIITFDHPGLQSDGRLYDRDSSFLYIYGGGLTYDVSPEFSLLVDYQHKYYDLGQQPPVRFYPQSATFGVVYHLPPRFFRIR